MAVPETLYDPSWYPDTGATNHVTPNSTNLQGKAPYNGDRKMKMENGETSSIRSIGTSFFFTPNLISPLFLNKLLHVPAITKNLLGITMSSLSFFFLTSVVSNFRQLGNSYSRAN
uniref:Retrovirus-related Pol polyprotein from transposon TNT 1-94-like beta-barrel domain-containing protein n=1 Tax=Cajanus cajan TaxID=3821 RepID=A0A151RJ25_CAJCA|nr:hypothetical protein KK1_035991 [Cajanus cajan]